MKRTFPTMLLVALLLSATSCATSSGQGARAYPAPVTRNQISVSYFYENLAPDGDWFQDPRFGWCWTPYDMSAEWRPYSDGHWEYTDYGWTWASNEPWGWATYHYGRWFLDETYGWAWVPGSEWAPAWVAWRSGEDWVGWAPLPPEARWDGTAGLTFADVNGLSPDDWCFVPRRQLLDVNLRLVVTSVARNGTLLSRSRDATRFEMRSGRPANLGIDIAQVEIRVGRSVTRNRVVDFDAPRGRGVRASGTVGAFRPVVRPPSSGEAPAPTLVGRRTDGPLATQRRLDAGRRLRLERDLAAERTRLTREQNAELRTEAAGPRAEEVRQRQVAEQRAFEEHAAQQRKVFDQRTQKRVVRPGPADRNGPKEKKNRERPNR